MGEVVVFSIKEIQISLKKIAKEVFGIEEVRLEFNFKKHFEPFKDFFYDFLRKIEEAFGIKFGSWDLIIKTQTIGDLSYGIYKKI